MAKKKHLLDANLRDRFKYEIAEDLGLTSEIENKGWGDMPTKQLGRIGGKIGGNMVKVMIRSAENTLESTDEPDSSALQ